MDTPSSPCPPATGPAATSSSHGAPPLTPHVGRPLAVVTGASSGIGRALALECARGGYDLAVIARTQDALQALAQEARAHGAATTVIAADLASADGCAAAIALVDALGRPVSALINNAGFGVYGPFHEQDARRLDELVALNVGALTRMTRHWLPDMVGRRCGRVLMVASTAAFQPGPLMAAYFASKAFVLHLSEAMSYECRATGVTITALCPGPTASGFQAAAKLEGSRLIVGRRLPSSEAVAAYAFRAMERGKRIAIPGLGNRVMAWSVRLAPRRLVCAMVARMQALKSA